jgi:putative endopeptidase
MNESAIEAQGLGPIREDLARRRHHSRAALVAEIHRQQQQGIAPVFRFSAQNDIKSSKNIIAAISQGGLGLPDREYYLRDDEKFKNTRREYVAHLDEDVRAGRHRIRESRHRRGARDRTRDRARPRVDGARRSAQAGEHVSRHAGLRAAVDAPLFQWPALFTSLGLSDLRSLNVAQPEYIREANRLLDEMPLETWKAYLRWNVSTRRRRSFRPPS